MNIDDVNSTINQLKFDVYNYNNIQHVHQWYNIHSSQAQIEYSQRFIVGHKTHLTHIKKIEIIQSTFSDQNGIKHYMNSKKITKYLEMKQHTIK